MLLDKALAARMRVVVRGRDATVLMRLDDALWQAPEEGFLPHGMAGGPHDAAQPVLLTTGAEAPNGATCLMSVDGADATVEEVKRFERVCVLFDGNDPDALQHARGQWKLLKDAGVSAQYWSEESGRWEKKAET